MTVHIERKASFLMPYSVEVNGKWYQLNKIRIYENRIDKTKTFKPEIIAETQGGWFEPLPPLRRLPHVMLETDKVVKRRAEKLDGKCFIIKDNDYWDTVRNPQYILYIPNDIAGFRRVSRFLSFHHVICDRYESEKLGARIDFYRPEFKVNERLNYYRDKFEEVKNGLNFRIENKEIDDQLEVLQRLSALYEQEKIRLENSTFMNL